jgi:hypothetical protein
MNGLVVFRRELRSEVIGFLENLEPLIKGQVSYPSEKEDLVRAHSKIIGKDPGCPVREEDFGKPCNICGERPWEYFLEPVDLCKVDASDSGSVDLEVNEHTLNHLNDLRLGGDYILICSTCLNS